MVVGVGTPSFNELVDGVDLGLVTNQTLLDLVQLLEDIALEQLVLLSVVLHVVVSNLLLEAVFVLADHLPDDHKASLFFLKVLLEVLGLGELVTDLVLHLVYTLIDLLELVVDTVLQVLDLLKVTGTRVNFDLKFSSSALSIVQLSLFEIQIRLHLVDVTSVGQLVLPGQSFGYVLEKG